MERKGLLRLPEAFGTDQKLFVVQQCNQNIKQSNSYNWIIFWKRFNRKLMTSTCHKHFQLGKIIRLALIHSHTHNSITVFFFLNNSVLIKWCVFRTYFTWSDDIRSCEVTKLLMLGLKNLAMFDSNMWKQHWQQAANNMPLSSKIHHRTAPLLARQGWRWPNENPRWMTYIVISLQCVTKCLIYVWNR